MTTELRSSLIDRRMIRGRDRGPFSDEAFQPSLIDPEANIIKCLRTPGMMAEHAGKFAFIYKKTRAPSNWFALA